MSKLAKFWSLTAFEKKSLILALGLLPLIKLGIHTFTYRQVMDRLWRSSNSEERPADEARVIKSTVKIVESAARHRLTGATCLTRSMTLWWLLRRQGVESEIRFGVRRGADGILAHAWVERDGIVLNDRSDIGKVYAAFESDTTLNKLNWQ